MYLKFKLWLIWSFFKEILLQGAYKWLNLESKILGFALCEKNKFSGLEGGGESASR